ncbi:MAG: hypothetical protein LBG59_02275 [Candidatus Peribacteria bacterium]|jgi:hypothetical protein|nr:hypothetical protein [Candidatus Peribacteria bacterium]
METTYKKLLEFTFSPQIREFYYDQFKKELFALCMSYDEGLVIYLENVELIGKGFEVIGRERKEPLRPIELTDEEKEKLLESEKEKNPEVADDKEFCAKQFNECIQNTLQMQQNLQHLEEKITLTSKRLELFE